MDSVQLAPHRLVIPFSTVAFQDVSDHVCSSPCLFVLQHVNDAAEYSYPLFYGFELRSCEALIRR